MPARLSHERSANAVVGNGAKRSDATLPLALDLALGLIRYGACRPPAIPGTGMRTGTAEWR